MASRFIIDIISGSAVGSRGAMGKPGVGTLVVSSSIELTPESSILYAAEVSGRDGTGLVLSGTAPTLSTGGFVTDATVAIDGNLWLKGNQLDLSGSTYPAKGPRFSNSETTHEILIAQNVPLIAGGTSEGGLVIKSTVDGGAPVSMMRFFTTAGAHAIEFPVNIQGAPAPGGKRVLVVNDNMRVDTDLQVMGDLTVQGNTTAIETSHLHIKDPIIFLNSGAVAQSLSAIVFGSGSDVASTPDLVMGVPDSNAQFSGLGGGRRPNSFVFFRNATKTGNVPNLPFSDNGKWAGIIAATGSFLQITGSLSKTVQGNDFLLGTGDTSVSYNKGSGQWTINSSGGGGGDGNEVFRDHGGTGGNPATGEAWAHATTSGSILINNAQDGDTRQLGDAGLINQGVGTNVVFYVSGTQSPPPTEQSNTILKGLCTGVSASVLLPDLHLSGALVGKGQDQTNMGTPNTSGILQIRANFVGISDHQGNRLRTGKNQYFFVTGSSLGAVPLGALNPNVVGNPGKLTPTDGKGVTAVFGGDVVTSGSLHLHEAWGWGQQRKFGPSVPGGVELSFSLSGKSGTKMAGGVRLFASGSALESEYVIPNNGIIQVVDSIETVNFMAGKVTVVATESTDNGRLIGEMMWAAKDDNTQEFSTTVRMVESGGKLGQGNGMMLEMTAGPGSGQVQISIRNNTGVTVKLSPVRLFTETFDV